ncbi:RNA-directed DNA polymerase, eukaryota [Tanacetum coccineum]
MNAKLAWIHEKYNHRSETHIGGSSSQTHEIGDVYLTAEELHQLHLDEEALRETLEEQTMDEKAREVEEVSQKQADDEESFMEFLGADKNCSDSESSDNKLENYFRMVPIKVNILAWKVKLDVLPTRFNLSKRGLDINSILCPICENYAESSSHLFFACSLARDIFRNIASWWDVKSPHVSSFEEWEMWTSSLTLSSRRKQILEGIIYIGWWSIWNFRNQVVFGSTIPSKASLFDDIVARTFQWCKHRGKFKFSLIDWLKNHYLVNI